MKSQLAEEIFELIEARSHVPTPAEFEMAYQARVVIDRIRFASSIRSSSRHERRNCVRRSFSSSMPWSG
jgi:hypothetical protein